MNGAIATEGRHTRDFARLKQLASNDGDGVRAVEALQLADETEAADRLLAELLVELEGAGR